MVLPSVRWMANRSIHDLRRDRAMIWDAHACLPLLPNQTMEALARHRAAGASYVSINVGMDFNPIPQILRVLASFRQWIKAHNSDYALAKTTTDIANSVSRGKLAIGFDLEGSAMLAGDPNMITLYRELGVNQIHLAYNRDNEVAGGCHGSNQGLTLLGRELVPEINRQGMIIDCSHSSHRTTMQIMEMSSRPVVFSHSNVRALCDHPRNILDDQIDACAKSGGVVAICGLGIFLGTREPGVE